MPGEQINSHTDRNGERMEAEILVNTNAVIVKTELLCIATIELGDGRVIEIRGECREKQLNEAQR